MSTRYGGRKRPTGLTDQAQTTWVSGVTCNSPSGQMSAMAISTYKAANVRGGSPMVYFAGERVDNQSVEEQQY